MLICSPKKSQIGAKIFKHRKPDTTVWKFQHRCRQCVTTWPGLTSSPYPMTLRVFKRISFAFDPSIYLFYGVDVRIWLNFFFMTFALGMLTPSSSSCPPSGFGSALNIECFPAAPPNDRYAIYPTPMLIHLSDEYYAERNNEHRIRVQHNSFWHKRVQIRFYR